MVQSFLDLSVDVPSLVSIYDAAAAAAAAATTFVARGLLPDGGCGLSGVATCRSHRRRLVLLVSVLCDVLR